MSSGEPAVTRAPLIPETGVQVHLIVRSGEQGGTAIQCRRVVTLIGSRQGNKVRLQHPSVAPVHSAIIHSGNDVLLVDLLSRSGTSLNGLNVEQEILCDGDVLAIDHLEFRVRLRQPEPSNNGDIHPFDLDPSPQAVALEHIPSGRVLQPNRRVCLLGRKDGCDILVDDTGVSRVHAALFSYYGRPVICDLLSRNQLIVNDVSVEFHELRDQDVIRVGETRFKARVVESKVVEKAKARVPRIQPSVALAPTERPPDMVDIGSVEGAQRWAIADKVQKARQAG